MENRLPVSELIEGSGIVVSATVAIYMAALGLIQCIHNCSAV